ncbi:MAG: ribosome maturation factor RimM [Aminivibrio sp.]
MRTDRFLIGRVTGAHGIRGELKIKVLTDNPSRFDKMKTLRLYRGEGEHFAELSIISIRHMGDKGIVLALTEEIRDRDGAEEMAGAAVEVFADERYPLEEGEWWVDDLLGMTALDHSTGEELGCVSEVIPTGGNDLYVIRDKGGRDHYIPAVKEFIADVNLDRKEIRISLIEGLWEP